MSDEVREDDHEPEIESPPVPSDEVAAALCARFEGSVFCESHGQPVVYLDAKHWADAAQYLRDEERFTMCVDITAVDHLSTGVRGTPSTVVAERFEMVANFLSHSRNRRVRLMTQLGADNPTVASLTSIYPGCNFPERETFDLLGIVFEGHPDLVRILMPEEWVGHPLRKDYAPARVPVTFKGDPSPR